MNTFFYAPIRKYKENELVDLSRTASRPEVVEYKLEEESEFNKQHYPVQRIAKFKAIEILND